MRATGAGEGPLLVGGLGRLGGRQLRVALAEAVHAAGLIEQLLLAGEEGVAVGADVEVHLAIARAGLERGARRPLGATAVAVERAGLVNRMDPGLHGRLLRCGGVPRGPARRRIRPVWTGSGSGKRGCPERSA